MVIEMPVRLSFVAYECSKLTNILRTGSLVQPLVSENEFVGLASQSNKV